MHSDMIYSRDRDMTGLPAIPHTRPLLGTNKVAQPSLHLNKVLVH
jgi:hypothetical protein